ncbi:prepilin cleavage protein [uncultured Legionella sp.]|uniref:PilW family protein n=1 Tax=uncultured Legionella sp. TaxID=210934 RepID=UPI002610B937|nr:prepilin cleavage protein [uncultured Legionella sp.]
MKFNSGFGLTEIMISLFLSSIIITGLIQLYLNVKQHYLESQKALEVHLEVQWISDLLSDSIRRSGFTPCLSVDRLVSMDMRNLGHVLTGFKWVSSEQSLFISRMSNVFSERIEFRSPTEIAVMGEVVFNKHRPLIIADCHHAEVHQILKIVSLHKGQLITIAAPMMYSYDQSVFVGEWIEEKWMIKNNGRGIDALYYQSIQTEELSSLVHSLSVSSELIDDKQSIKIKMMLEQNKIHEVIAVVRGS